MPTYQFAAFEVDSSYYFNDAQSPVLSRQTLEITDSVDDDLHRTVEEDPNNDQTFSFANEPAVTDYTVQFLDFAQVNGTGPEFELYAMQVSFSDGSTKYFVMSKDENFSPEVGDDVAVTTFSNFVSTSYGEIGSAVCYTTGTPIRTPGGDTPVEQLRRGDMVQTKDNGCKEILWIGRRMLEQTDLQQAESLRPVLVRAGVLGNPAPLLVSQQHRLLVDRAALGEDLPWPEAFVKAKFLAEYCKSAARIAHGKRQVCYHHLLLDSHEVIFAGRAESESLFPGPMAIKGISRSDRAEIAALFPELAIFTKQANLPDFTLARPDVPRRLFKRGRFDGSLIRRGGARAAAA